jgi:hypothetical protein
LQYFARVIYYKNHEHLLQKPRKPITKTTSIYYKNHDRPITKTTSIYYKNHESLLQKHEAYYKNHVASFAGERTAITKARKLSDQHALREPWQLLQFVLVVIAKNALHL